MTFPFPSMASSFGIVAFGWLALAWKETDAQNNVTTPTPITFSTDVIDDGDLHSASKFTIPAAWNGRYALFNGNVTPATSGSASTNLSYALKGGSGFFGAGAKNGGANSDVQINICCAPVPVATAEEYEVYSDLSGGDDLDAPNNLTWACMELLPTSFSGALAYKTGTQAILAATYTAVTFDAEVYDTNTYHDNATNNSRMTTQSGENLVQFFAGISSTGGAGEMQVILQKNDANFAGMFQTDHEVVGGGDYTCAVSPPLVVSGGTDHFRVMYFHTSATTINNDGHTFFAIRGLPSGTKYAFVSRITSNFDVGVATYTPISYNNEIADTDGFYSGGSPSKFIIPAGLAGYYRIGANVRTVSDTSLIGLQIWKNGATFPGSGNGNCLSPADDGLNICSAVVYLEVGDEIEVVCYASLGADVASSDATWAWIMKVEALSA